MSWCGRESVGTIERLLCAQHFFARGKGVTRISIDVNYPAVLPVASSAACSVVTDTDGYLLTALDCFTTSVGKVADQRVNIRRQSVILRKGRHRRYRDCHYDGNQR